MVKMKAGILGNMRSLNKVAYNPGIIRYLAGNTEGAVQVQGRRDAMRLRAYPANPLSYYLSIPGVPAPQDDFKPGWVQPLHGAPAPMTQLVPLFHRLRGQSA